MRTARDARALPTHVHEPHGGGARLLRRARVQSRTGRRATDKPAPKFARNCILARRLVEKGVRFVQLFNGGYAMGEGVGNWDGHKTLENQYSVHGHVIE
jgi:hypothetical protein